MTTPNIDLGRFGVFTWDPDSNFVDLGLAVSPEQAQEIEWLGYGTLWVTGSPAAELSFAEPLLESTTALKVATGIVNIWTADAKTVAESFHRINTAHPGSCSASGPAIPSTRSNIASPMTRWSTTSMS
jgi:hypothetical protein